MKLWQRQPKDRDDSVKIELNVHKLSSAISHNQDKTAIANQSKSEYDNNSILLAGINVNDFSPSDGVDDRSSPPFKEETKRGDASKSTNDASVI